MPSSQTLHTVRIVLIDLEGRRHDAELKPLASSAVRIGRAPENDIQALSPFISRVHAELWPHEKGALYRDLKSTSGTYLDGRRVSELVLQPGTTVRLGSIDGMALSIEFVDSPPEREGPGDHHGSSWSAGGNTQILKVAELGDSPYLTGERAPLQELSHLKVGRRPGSTEEHKGIEARLRSLISVTSDLMQVSDSQELAELLLGRVLEMLPVDRGMVLLEEDGEMQPCAWGVREQIRGVSRSDLLTRTRSLLSDGGDESGLDRPMLPFKPIGTVVDQVVRDGVGLLTLDAQSDQRFEKSKSLVLQAVRSIMAVPIATGGQVFGVIYLDTQSTLSSEDGGTLDYLVAVGRQAGMVISSLRLIQTQKRMLESLMKALAASIDAKDGTTAGHSARVAHYSVGISKSMGWDERQQNQVYYAALLHDYGKIGIDDSVLKKPSALTDEEYKHIQLHPKFSFDILSKIEWPEELKNLALEASTHHERMDGKGYPFGLAGEEIPMIGRIIAIADVYDALTRKRHYRDPMPMPMVLKHLDEGRGDRFDSAALDGFFAYHEAVLREREDRRAATRAKGVAAAVDPRKMSASGRFLVVDEEAPSVDIAQRPTVNSSSAEDGGAGTSASRSQGVGTSSLPQPILLLRKRPQGPSEP